MTEEKLSGAFNSKLLLIIEKFEDSLPDIEEVGLDKYMEIRKLKIADVWQEIRDVSATLIIDEVKEQADRFIKELKL